MPSEDEIIRLVKSGRNDEFRTLVCIYQKQSLTLAYRMVGKWSDAEDATQDAFVRAFRSIRTYSEDGHFWPWFRQILVNCCIKRMSREVPVEDIDTMVEASQPFVNTIEDDVIRKCELDTVRKAISGLPPDYRAVVVLRYQQDLATAEIAEVLSITGGTVRIRLHRAMKMLADRLAVINNEV